MIASRVCIVTGGGAGIGRACVERFARAGWIVVAADVDGTAARRAAAELSARTAAEVVGLECDVSEAAACQRVADEAVRRWGRIDALVANAGVQIGGRLLDASEADWDRLVGVNLRGVANSCRAALPAMIAGKDGRIVVVSSINAVRPPKAMAVYDATKAGVIGLMRSIAVDHGADGVRANAVCPGATLTDHHIRAAAARGCSEVELRRSTVGYGLLGRVGEPSEIAAAIHFLASDAASFMTGAVFHVDGGATVGGQA